MDGKSRVSEEYKEGNFDIQSLTKVLSLAYKLT